MFHKKEGFHTLFKIVTRVCQLYMVRQSVPQFGRRHIKCPVPSTPLRPRYC